jgi:hypothetical protein
MHVKSPFHRQLGAIVLGVCALAVSACDTTTGAPSMSFAAPQASQPASGAIYQFAQQPITLKIANAPRTGTSAVVYKVEVATADTFASPVFSRDDVPEGGDGVTSVQLPPLAGNATYYWRARAVVDGVSGEPGAAANFVVRPNIVLDPPQPASPASGSVTSAARPVFTVTNAGRSGAVGPVTYEFQVATSSAFSGGSVVASASVAEQPSQTSWTPANDLPEGILFWRARAIDPQNAVSSAFAAPASFERKAFGAPGDQIDLSTVTVVLGLTSIGRWPATAVVTDTVAGPGALCIYHTKLGVWPRVTFFGDPGTLAEGNQWIFANIGGRWYGGAGHWYRPGQACKDVDANSVAGGTFYQDTSEPLRSWVPRFGETFAVMSATPARFYPDKRTVDERSNVVLERWGG